MIESKRCPPAVESEEGTVHEDANTSNKPTIDNILPIDLLLPLIKNHIPSGIKHKGIQNQIAASSI